MNDFNLFSINNLIQFLFLRKLFTLILSKKIFTKFQFDNKNYFYFLLLKKMNFYNLIYKNISI